MDAAVADDANCGEAAIFGFRHEEVGDGLTHRSAKRKHRHAHYRVI
jgi:hypothetical protein